MNDIRFKLLQKTINNILLSETDEIIEDQNYGISDIINQTVSGFTPIRDLQTSNIRLALQAPENNIIGYRNWRNVRIYHEPLNNSNKPNILKFDLIQLTTSYILSKKDMKEAENILPELNKIPMFNNNYTLHNGKEYGTKNNRDFVISWFEESNRMFDMLLAHQNDSTKTITRARPYVIASIYQRVIATICILQSIIKEYNELENILSLAIVHLKNIIKMCYDYEIDENNPYDFNLFKTDDYMNWFLEEVILTPRQVKHIARRIAGGDSVEDIVASTPFVTRSELG